MVQTLETDETKSRQEVNAKTSWDSPVHLLVQQLKQFARVNCNEFNHNHHQYTNVCCVLNVPTGEVDKHKYTPRLSGCPMLKL